MCSAIYFARPKTSKINKAIIKWGLVRPTAPPVVPTVVGVVVGVVLVVSGDVVVVLVAAVEVVGVVVHI